MSMKGTAIAPKGIRLRVHNSQNGVAKSTTPKKGPKMDNGQLPIFEFRPTNFQFWSRDRMRTIVVEVYLS